MSHTRMLSILVFLIALNAPQVPLAYQPHPEAPNREGAKPVQQPDKRQQTANANVVRGNNQQQKIAEAAGRQPQQQPWNRADVINLIIAVATTLYFVATVFILKAMLRANRHAEKSHDQNKQDADADRDLSRRQYEAYERPWVKASIEISSELSFINGDARLLITPIMTNVGKSVATNICIAAELIAVPQDGPRHRNVLKERVAALKRPVTAEDGVALFPGEVNNSEVEVYFAPKTDIEAFCHERNGIKYVNIAFIGAVYYQFATSESDHRTRFVYLLAFRGKPLLGDIQVGATLASSDIFTLKLSNFDSAT